MNFYSDVSNNKIGVFKLLKLKIYAYLFLRDLVILLRHIVVDTIDNPRAHTDFIKGESDCARELIHGINNVIITKRPYIFPQICDVEGSSDYIDGYFNVLLAIKHQIQLSKGSCAAIELGMIKNAL